MSPEAERLLEEALKLSDEDREVLAVILEDGLGDGSTEEEREAAWGAEIQRRLEAVRAGEVRLIPWEEVQRELEAIVERGRARRDDGMIGRSSKSLLPRKAVLRELGNMAIRGNTDQRQPPTPQQPWQVPHQRVEHRIPLPVLPAHMQVR